MYIGMNTKIPKIIHYCWVGPGELGELEKRCIASWEKMCPDYEIVRWDESNMDFSDCQYAMEAYSSKKWAFVTDYMRLKALYTYGGIYLDTDVELIKPISDEFLKNDAFVSYAEGVYIGTGLIACKKSNIWCKKMLDYYYTKSFFSPSGKMNLEPNNEIVTKISYNELGFRPGKDSFINYGGVRIYPEEYFSPYKKNIVGSKKENNVRCNFNCTENTIAIHYYTLSWINEKSDGETCLLVKLLRFFFPQRFFQLVKKQYVLLKLKGFL